MPSLQTHTHTQSGDLVSVCLCCSAFSRVESGVGGTEGGGMIDAASRSEGGGEGEACKSIKRGRIGQRSVRLGKQIENVQRREIHFANVSLNSFN